MTPIRVSFPAVSATAVCASQTTAGSGALSLNGGLLNVQTGAVILGTGIQRVVSITSTGNLSAINFTITGTDATGAVVTETRVGPNNTTVSTTAEYMTVTSVSVDAAVGTAVTLGSGSTGKTKWMPMNHLITPFNVGVGVVVTATANVTVQHTFDAPSSSATAFSHSSLAAITASADGNYSAPVQAIRCVMNSSSGSGAFVFSVIQAGI